MLIEIYTLNIYARMRKVINFDKMKEKNGRKVQQDYRLFRIRDGKLRLLDMVIDGGNGWAVDLWDAVEDEL